MSEQDLVEGLRKDKTEKSGWNSAEVMQISRTAGRGSRPVGSGSWRTPIGATRPLGYGRRRTEDDMVLFQVAARA